MSTLDELGREQFRATVQICPHCLAIYDGRRTNVCECGVMLEVHNVKIVME